MGKVKDRGGKASKNRRIKKEPPINDGSLAANPN